MGDRLFGQVGRFIDPAEASKHQIEQELKCGQLDVAAAEASHLMNNPNIPASRRKQLADDIQRDTFVSRDHLVVQPLPDCNSYAGPGATWKDYQISIIGPSMNQWGQVVNSSFTIADLRYVASFGPRYNSGYCGNTSGYYNGALNSGYPIGYQPGYRVPPVVAPIVNAGIRSYQQYELHKQEERQLHRLERQHQWQY